MRISDWSSDVCSSDLARRAALVDAAMRVIDDPAFADIFAPDALAEAPVAAVVGETVVAGTVDRLLVTDGHVRVIDFKTGSRVPARLAEVPVYQDRKSTRLNSSH